MLAWVVGRRHGSGLQSQTMQWSLQAVFGIDRNVCGVVGIVVDVRGFSCISKATACSEDIDSRSWQQWRKAYYNLVPQ